jgi:hypothetical protein
MTTYRRAGAKWTINECLKLQREFELLNLSVEEISILHERSPQAIMYKLDAEGFADYNELAGQQSQQHTSTLKDDDSDYQEDSDSDYEEDTDDDDAASEISDNEEDEEYDAYNIRQQVRLLTKQLSALTAFVMKTFKDRKSDIIKFEDLAGSR